MNLLLKKGPTGPSGPTPGVGPDTGSEVGPGTGSGAAPTADPLDPDNGDRLLCRDCGRIITRSGARMEMHGSHRHVFSNPHGYVFEVGCFTTAPGCRCPGPATTEFTWFPGRAWQVAICGGCGLLMGWRYTAATIPSGADDFFGLILPHLVEKLPD